MKKILIVGEKQLCMQEANKLKQKGLTFNDMHFLDKDITWEILKKNLTNDVGNILFIQTKNGQTGYLAGEIKKVNKNIKVFGIKIPDHPNIRRPKNEDHFSKIECATQIFTTA